MKLYIYLIIFINILLITGFSIYGIEQTNSTEIINYTDINNNFIDKINLMIPSLSNETYEVGMTILDVQSYPMVGGNWTVRFNTIGTADLKITVINGTTFRTDLEFLEIRCGDKTKEYKLQGGSVFVEDYSCDEVSYEVSKVLIAGKHTLEFDFGGIKAYAKNQAGWWNSSWLSRKQINVSNTYGSTLTEYQIELHINTTELIDADKLRSDCTDLRFTNDTGDLIPYYIDENARHACNTADTIIWIQTDSLANGVNTSFYMYYNNSAETISLSDKWEVFNYTSPTPVMVPVGGENDDDIEIVSYRDGNTIKMGSFSALLNESDTGAVGAQSQTTLLNVTQPVAGVGDEAGEGDSLVPLGFAGTLFGQYGERAAGTTNYYAYSFYDNNNVSVWSGTWNILVDSATVNKGEVGTLTSTTSDGFKINSTYPVVIYRNEGSYDQMVFYPATDEYYCWGGSNLYFVALESGTTVNCYDDDGTATTPLSNANPGDVFSDTSPGSGNVGDAYYCNGTKPFGVNQQADGDGNEQSECIAPKELDSEHYLPVTTGYSTDYYMAVITREANVNCTIWNGATYVTSLLGGSQTFPYPNQMVFANAAITKGMKVNCSAPVMIVHDDNDNEMNLFSLKASRRYVYPEPAYWVGSEESLPEGRLEYTLSETRRSTNTDSTYSLTSNLRTGTNPEVLEENTYRVDITPTNKPVHVIDSNSLFNFKVLTTEVVWAALSLVLNNNYGTIDFQELLDISNLTILDLDENVNISDNYLRLNATALPQLNKSVKLTISDLIFSNIRILKNGEDCRDCDIVNYSDGDVIFNAPGFTYYQAAEGAIPALKVSKNVYIKNTTMSVNGLPYNNSYPSNVKIDIGYDGDNEFNYSGTLDSEQNFTNFTDELRDILPDCNCAGCTLSDLTCTIQINVTSDTKGTVVLGDLNITQDIKNATWPQETSYNLIDLDDYFYDENNLTLVYNYTNLDNIDVSINNGYVTLTPDAGWYGVEYVYFNASDGEYKVDSNRITLNVTQTMPLFYYNSTNTTSPSINEAVLHNINWTADNGLSLNFFEINITGSVKNFTTTLSGTSQDINITNTTSSSPSKYYWKSYTNDSLGKWNSTNRMFVTVTDKAAPYFTNYGNNDTTPNQNGYMNLSLTINDNVDISYYIFSTNESGSWQNDSSWVSLSGIQTIYFNWTIRQTTSAEGTTLGWAFFANDSSSKLNRSTIQTYTVNYAPTLTANNMTDDDAATFGFQIDPITGSIRYIYAWFNVTDLDGTSDINFTWIKIWNTTSSENDPTYSNYSLKEEVCVDNTCIYNGSLSIRYWDEPGFVWNITFYANDSSSAEVKITDNFSISENSAFSLVNTPIFFGQLVPSAINETAKPGYGYPMQTNNTGNVQLTMSLRSSRNNLTGWTNETHVIGLGNITYDDNTDFSSEVRLNNSLTTYASLLVKFIDSQYWMIDIPNNTKAQQYNTTLEITSA